MIQFNVSGLAEYEENIQSIGLAYIYMVDIFGYMVSVPTSQLQENSMLLGKTPCNHCNHCNHHLFSYYLAYFDAFLLYLYISSSVDKSVDSVDRVFRLDIVGVKGLDLTVLPTALNCTSRHNTGLKTGYR